MDLAHPYLFHHQQGVAYIVLELGKSAGLQLKHLEDCFIAALLHDIGALTKEEMTLMKSHTYHTYAIINSIEGLKDMARWAAYHHEKLDGSGYPFHCKDEEIETKVRIMGVADILTALSEDRPYKSGYASY